MQQYMCITANEGCKF